MKCLALFIIALIFTSCNDQIVVSPQEGKQDTVISKPVTDTIINDSMVLPLTNEILQIIKEKKYTQLSNYIDPVLGVRFSPYGHIDTITDQKFTNKEFVIYLTNNKTKIIWGSFDGSGDPIKLTIEEYFKRFVYDVEFTNAEKVSLNKVLYAGNTLNNLDSIYQGSTYTESYFSGFEEKYNGMDWRSLILVFRKNKNAFYLIGIIHNQWTI